MAVVARLLGAVLLGCAVYSAAGNVASGDAQTVTLAHSEQFTLHASATDRDYLIQVALPSVAPPAQGYAVLYVLDGNAYWPLLRQAHQLFARDTPVAEPTPLLIVGIGYPGVDRFNFDARAEDDTPPLPQSTVAADPRQHGGADRFLAFITEQLQPAINARYAVDTERRAIVGHSFGGLFVLYTLLRQPRAFDAYFAISPSLWWGDGYLPRALQQQPVDAAVANRCVFIGVGELEQTPKPANRGTPRGQLVHERAMVANARAYARQLQSTYPALELTFSEFAGERHGTVMWPAARRVLAELTHCDAVSTAEQ